MVRGVVGQVTSHLPSMRHAAGRWQVGRFPLAPQHHFNHFLHINPINHLCVLNPFLPISLSVRPALPAALSRSLQARGGAGGTTPHPFVFFLRTSHFLCLG